MTVILNHRVITFLSTAHNQSVYRKTKTGPGISSRRPVLSGIPAGADMHDTAEDLFNNEGREPCAAQERTAKLMLPCRHKKHHIVPYPPGDEILRAVGERGKLKGVFDVFYQRKRSN